MIARPSPLVKVSLNNIPVSLPKPKGGHPYFAQRKHQWRVILASPADLEYYVRLGYCFAAEMSGGECKEEHFISGQVVCVDFDTDDDRSSMDVVMSDLFVYTYASFLYTTLSHGIEGPRCRAVFFLSEPVTDAGLWQDGQRGMLQRWPHADQVTWNAGRSYFGSPGCEIKLCANEMELPIATFLEDAASWRQQVERGRVANEARARANAIQFGENHDGETYHGKLGPMLVNDVRNAPQGERNQVLYSKGIKARERFSAQGAEYWLEHMVQAAIANGLEEHEARTTRNSIMKGVLI